MTFTMLSPTEGSASVARCDPDVGSESESGMSVMTGAVSFWKEGSFQLLISHTTRHQFGHLPSPSFPFQFWVGFEIENEKDGGRPKGLMNSCALCTVVHFSRVTSCNTGEIACMQYFVTYLRINFVLCS